MSYLNTIRSQKYRAIAHALQVLNVPVSVSRVSPRSLPARPTRFFLPVGFLFVKDADDVRDANGPTSFGPTSACVARQMLLLAVSDATATILALLLFGLLALLLFSAHRTTNRIEADDAEEKTSQRAVRTGSKATPELRSAVDLRCAIDSLKTLYDEYKYIELGELLDAIRADISSCKHGNQATLDAKEKLEALLLSDTLPQIEARIRTCKDALAALSDAEGWELVNKKKEMRMFQRWREGNELQVKIEAVLGPDPPVRTADTIIVWREAQLYGKWFPMISSGFKIKEFSHCEVVIHLIAALNFMHCGEFTTRRRSSTCGHASHGCSLADGDFESRHPRPVAARLGRRRASRWLLPHVRATRTPK